MALIKLPILKVGQKDENGIVHNEFSLMHLAEIESDCVYENKVLYLKQEIKDILGIPLEQEGIKC